MTLPLSVVLIIISARFIRTISQNNVAKQTFMPRL